MITEDNKMEFPMNKIIRRRLLKRYGDLSFAQMAWDNIEYRSDYSFVPDFFIKIVQPNDSFKMTLVLRNENVNRVNTLFLEHLLVLDAKEVDNENMVNGLLAAIKYHHVEYAYTSINIPWTAVAVRRRVCGPGCQRHRDLLELLRHRPPRQYEDGGQQQRQHQGDRQLLPLRQRDAHGGSRPDDQQPWPSFPLHG